MASKKPAPKNKAVPAFDEQIFHHIFEGHFVSHDVCAELRSADEIGRYGGDEFVVLLPQTSAQEALPLAERIHASIAVMSMDTENGPLTLTISIDIAQTIHNTEKPDSVQNLLLRADKALYAAKQNGRNCTEIFD